MNDNRDAFWARQLRALGVRVELFRWMLPRADREKLRAIDGDLLSFQIDRWAADEAGGLDLTPHGLYARGNTVFEPADSIVAHRHHGHLIEVLYFHGLPDGATAAKLSGLWIPEVDCARARPGWGHPSWARTSGCAAATRDGFPLTSARRPVRVADIIRWRADVASTGGVLSFEATKGNGPP